MRKADLLDSLAFIVLIVFMCSMFYGMYCYMQRVDKMVEQYRIEFNK